MSSITIYPGKLTLAQMRMTYQQPVKVSLSQDAEDKIKKSVECVNNVIKNDKPVYGINTGFGLLANRRIETADLELLQRSIVLSHAAGVGKPLEDDLVRLIMLLKINSLSRGCSGARLEVIQAIINLINA